MVGIRTCGMVGNQWEPLCVSESNGRGCFGGEHEQSSKSDDIHPWSKMVGNIPTILKTKKLKVLKNLACIKGLYDACVLIMVGKIGKLLL